MKIIDLDEVRRRRAREKAADPSYAAAKFGSAVYVLATRDTSMQERVRAAADSFSPVTEDDMPDDQARGEFAELQAGLDRDPTSMTAGDWRHLARLICDLSVTLDLHENARGR